MRIRTLETQLWLPHSIDKVFAFYADAGNLDRITPDWLHFHIVTPLPIDIQQGTILDYRLRVHGLPIRWRSEISEWQPPNRFVDRQLKGPYRQWIHEHDFEWEREGTLIRDRVSYAVPGWICEPILHRLLVGPDLRRIFEHRNVRTRELLG